MDFGVFAMVYVAGGAALALWVDQRFPSLTPGRMRGVLANLLVSVAIAQLAVPLSLPWIATAGGASVLFVAVMTVVLAALVYACLASIWLIKLAIGAAGGLLR